jgi:hypothetical protein
MSQTGHRTAEIPACWAQPCRASPLAPELPRAHQDVTPRHPLLPPLLPCATTCQRRLRRSCPSSDVFNSELVICNERIPWATRTRRGHEVICIQKLFCKYKSTSSSSSMRHPPLPSNPSLSAIAISPGTPCLRLLLLLAPASPLRFQRYSPPFLYK